MIFSFARATHVWVMRSLRVFAIPLTILPNLAVAEPPLSAFGEYIGAGCPSVGKAGTCIATTPDDRVRIFRDKNANAMVSVRIIFDRGHICTLEGAATWMDGHYTLRSDGLDQNKPCQLELLINGAVLTLDDPDALCREVYCGTRGAFDGARFMKLPENSKR